MIKMAIVLSVFFPTIALASYLVGAYILFTP